MRTQRSGMRAMAYLQTEGQTQDIELLNVEVDTNGRLIIVAEDVISESIYETRLSDGNVSDDNTFSNP